MASKNIFSDGYTQFPDASGPDSISWFAGLADAPWSTGHAAELPLVRGMVDITRSVCRPGCDEVPGTEGLSALLGDDQKSEEMDCVHDLDCGLAV